MSKFARKVVLGACALVVCVEGVESADLNPTSQRLGFCEFIYFYAAQYAQLGNNEGAAKAYLNRSALMTASFFILEQEGGVIKGEKIKAARMPGLKMKPEFDKDPQVMRTEVGKCDKEVIGIADRVRQSGATLWGKRFAEVHTEIFAKNRAALGIN